VKLRFYTNWFDDGLKLAVENGNLLLLRWQIFRQETKLHPEDMSSRLPLGRSILRRWTRLEGEHGKDCLIVDQHQAFSFNPGILGVFLGPTNPTILENSWKLRQLMGEVWWQREHQLEALAATIEAERQSNGTGSP
jgi:hypothetical protein